MERGLQYRKFRNTLLLRRSHKKKFGLYFKCEDSVSHGFETRDEVTFIKSSFRLLCDKYIVEYRRKFSQFGHCCSRLGKNCC